MEQIRAILFYKDYFDVFFNSVNIKAKNKIDEVLFMITILERVPSKFLKRIESIKGLYEIRVEYESNIFRIFCCFDKGKLIVLFNGFHKKTQKKPINELQKAEKIMNEYFNEIKNNNYGKQ